MKTIFPGPTKTIFAARAADPDRRMGSLHRLRKYRNVLVLKKLTAKIHWLVGPGLTNDFNAFVHAARRFLLIDLRLALSLRLASFSNTEIQPPVGNDVNHGVRLRGVDGIVQRQNIDRDAETNPFRRARDGRH